MTGENGQPETPDWSVIDFLAARMRRDQKQPVEIPPNIELGDN